MERCRRSIARGPALGRRSYTVHGEKTRSVVGVARALAILTLALFAWVLPASAATPIDADGPSGVSDNADFDDLIVSLTSPTAAVVQALVSVTASLAFVAPIHLLKAICGRRLIPPTVDSRAPPSV